MKKPDWEAIRREYETDGLSARKLAEKYGISHTAINQKAKAKGWKKPAKVATEKVSKSSKGGNKKVETRKVETRPVSQASKSVGEAEKLTLVETGLGFEPAQFGLSDQQALFVYWYIRTNSRVEAYRRAGYQCEGKNAYFGASQIYRNIQVSKAIREMQKRLRQRYTADMDEIVDQLVAITRADPNVLSQYRRLNCRHCWGENHLYQWRDIREFDIAAEKNMKDGKAEPEYGGLGFVDNADPNPDCPRCHGEGVGEAFFADTRDLHGPESHYFLGVKENKFGIEILTEDKKAARQMLIQLLTAQAAKDPADNNKGLEEDYQLQALTPDEPTPDDPIL
ncbi:terminase small subunit [Serratia aquatilis]|uniref:Terminase small subunit n=1 Tax=Serratia aquatilis TaxID=1737515 RepID=A0ABV6E9M2_9GAMM